MFLLLLDQLHLRSSGIRSQRLGTPDLEGLHPSRIPGHFREAQSLLCVVVCVLSHVWFFGTPWTVACQSPLSIEFSRQEYWSGLPCPLPGDLPDPGVEPTFLAYPALAGGFLPLCHLGSPQSQLLPWKPVSSHWDCHIPGSAWQPDAGSGLRYRIMLFVISQLHGLKEGGEGICWGRNWHLFSVWKELIEESEF